MTPHDFREQSQRPVCNGKRCVGFIRWKFGRVARFCIHSAAGKPLPTAKKPPYDESGVGSKEQHLVGCHKRRDFTLIESNASLVGIATAKPV